jgi:hypothetical protein
LLLHPPEKGTYKLTVELTQWITAAVLFRREVIITAS